jgi:stage 0 sporulation regulatory protein
MKKQELSNEIEKKREELIRVASASGLTSSKAIRCSQELDLLLNTYNSIFINKIKMQ